MLLRLAFDVVERADPRQGAMRPLGVGGPRLVELPPRVHQAPDLDDLPRAIQPIVGRVRIRLEIALEALEDRFRSGATPVRGVMIGHVWVVVVANRGPEPAGLDPLAVVVL